MSQPRAQRTVAPTTQRKPGARVGAARAAPRFEPGDSFVSFAYAVLARETAALAAHRRAGEEMPTPDRIHQMRVAARRLRVALRLFQRVLPRKRAARFTAELRWFARALGDIRDLDVYTESFKAYAQGLPPEQRRGLSGYQLYLRRERAEARATAAAAVASKRATALLAGLERFVAAGPSAAALRRWRSLSVRDALRESVRNSVNRVQRIGNRLTARARPAELHKLRIKTKRLRYELEFFSEVYPPLKPTALECKALQDLLGTHQDVYAATARLRRYAALLRKQGAGRELPPALARVRKHLLAIARDVRVGFRTKWPAFVAATGAARELVA